MGPGPSFEVPDPPIEGGSRTGRAACDEELARRAIEAYVGLKSIGGKGSVVCAGFAAGGGDEDIWSEDVRLGGIVGCKGGERRQLITPHKTD